MLLEDAVATWVTQSMAYGYKEHPRVFSSTPNYFPTTLILRFLGTYPQYLMLIAESSYATESLL